MRIQGQYGNQKRLGEILLDRGFVDQADLDRLLQLQRIYLKRQSDGVRKDPAAPPLSAQIEAPPPPPVSGAEPGGGRKEAGIARVLALAVKLGASDVHVHSGAPIAIRVGGRLAALKMPPVDAEQAEKLVTEYLSPEEREALASTGDLDLALHVPGIGRFRASVYRQRRGLDAVLRPIPPQPPDLESLGLPSIIARLATFHQGLVLVTGPSGCGKSSTLAALIRLVNEDRRDHVITVEDPIEYVHPSLCCVVNQRQVKRHTESFATALRAALREDPDIIAIGELRDLETTQLAITAAETGHLVLATLHTGGVIRTIDRIIDAFPPRQQPQVRAMLSESLRAVLSQRLVPTVDGRRRVPATELLFVTPAISHLIREQKSHQILSILQTGRAQGMCLLDDSLVELVRTGAVRQEVARRFADDPRRFV
ncbi:MAG: PilT/PilU family type 4a pilus ATPase [Deltaproteobacteria bacterium]|nr:PilT/PilU family type 4a pilus ATPase [Deltaproteobacteria bacterium]